MDPRQETLEKTVLREVLEAFRANTCLWDPSDPPRRHKDARNEANNALLQIYRRARPRATLPELKKKLDNMRTTYKKEAKKVVDSLGSQRLYKPQLWYYDLMHVVEEHRDRDKDMGDPLRNFKFEEVIVDHGVFDDCQSNPVSDIPDEDSYSNPHMEPWEAKRVKRDFTCNNLSGENGRAVTTGTDEEWEVIGKSLGIQLKQLRPDQRIVAQKLMSDTIFFGNLNKLSESSHIVLRSSVDSTSPLQWTPSSTS